MQTKEYFTKDKSTWGDGPWQQEPDKIQWEDKETGFPCLIVRNGIGSLCGYVGLPNTHDFYGASYDDVPADAHGGLTFASKCQEGPEDETVCHVPDPGESDDVWWIGFDCAHSGDLSSGTDMNFGKCIYRTMDYVKQEVQNLARQLSK